KTTNGVTTSHIYDGQNIVMDDKAGEKQVFVRGLSPISRTVNGGSKEYYTFNTHGDTTALVNASGTILKDYTYDAFGNQKQEQSEDNNPFRYCGEYFDSETGFIYLRARYYDSSIGRFTSEDPIRDGMNWFVYCGNNPINLVDPSGFKAGDLFVTIDDAAIDFGLTYNPISIAGINKNGEFIEEGFELGTIVYEIIGEDGQTYYTYNEPVEGDSGGCNPKDAEWEGNAKAILHTHGRVSTEQKAMADEGYSYPDPDIISGEDDSYARSLGGIPNYAVTPGGLLIKFTPDMNVKKSWHNNDKAIGTSEIISIFMPYDEKSEMVRYRSKEEKAIYDAGIKLERLRSEYKKRNVRQLRDMGYTGTEWLNKIIGEKEI
ncbi:RHS repeat-associated core domain-containing protein, partial [Acetivibrio sp. MSJd-27]|uniref:RHS repeat-associated core domain-containing protein n=1 Tax=Acetivibrio sp. MSJd-27 TaxID=2841523 RepID=UPI001C1088B1